MCRLQPLVAYKSPSNGSHATMISGMIETEKREVLPYDNF